MKYKTIHENEVFINPPKEVKHYNMGEILFEIEKLKTQQEKELSEISAKKNKTEEIKNLISSTPNDQELGEKIREMFG